MWTPPERIRHSLPILAPPTSDEAARSRLFSPLDLRSGCSLESRARVPAMVSWRASECMPTELSDAPGPFARNAPAQARVRAAIREAGLRAPGVVAGEIATFDRTEALLARRDADLVASARQTLCDPDGFEKARLGLDNQVLRCLFTNYCEALDQRHRAVTCQRWDRLELDTPGVRTVPGDDARPGPRRRATAPTRQPAAEGSAQLMNEEATR